MTKVVLFAIEVFLVFLEGSIIQGISYVLLGHQFQVEKRRNSVNEVILELVKLFKSSSLPFVVFVLFFFWWVLTVHHNKCTVNIVFPSSGFIFHSNRLALLLGIITQTDHSYGFKRLSLYFIKKKNEGFQNYDCSLKAWYFSFSW